MKRILAVICAAIFIASVLSSCAGGFSTTPAALSSPHPHIRITSSDAADAAAWLAERLGETLTGSVVIGTDAAGYDVDVSALEDDGFFIRSFGREDVLFAKTADGLDRAARRYAKFIEAGEQVADVTFHEGPRIERLVLAGSDISTYAIRVESENDYVRKWVTDNVAFTFSELIGIACGFAPEVGGDAEHFIILRSLPSEELPDFRESSYNYHFENGDLVIEFAEMYGARNGALMFLENECGWTDLILGMDVLAESDLVDVPAELDVTVHPTLSGGFCQCIRNPYSTLRRVNPSLADYSYKIPSAHHALGSTWASRHGTDYTGHFPCLTDEYVLEDTVDDIVAHIGKRLDAGEKLGDDMAHIDLGMEDGDASSGRTFCKCKNCYAVYVEEGATWAGPMIRFANAVEEAVDAAGFDGIKYSVFAYAGSNMPPRKTAPNDDLYVTIVLHDSCDAHFVDGSQCDRDAGGKYMIGWNRNYTGGARMIVNNKDWGQWIRDWRGLGTHLYVRMATLCHPGAPFMTMYTIYENMKFFAENDVMSIYNESYAIGGFDFNYLVGELYQLCHYYPGLSHAEYYEQYCRLLEKYYGEGWRDVRFIADTMREAELNKSCSCAWGGGLSHYDLATIDENWDEMTERAGHAVKCAASSLEEYFCNMVKAIVTNVGCYAAYNIHGTESERWDVARGRWADMVSALGEMGYEIIDASEIPVTSYVGGVARYGERSGNVIFFPLEKVGIWPYAYRIEPTLDEEYKTAKEEGGGSLY